MWFILKANTNYYRKNLPISNKVAIIILDKYSNTNFYKLIEEKEGKLLKKKVE